MRVDAHLPLTVTNRVRRRNKHRHRVVIVGSTSVVLYGGQSKSAIVTLNRAGKRLLGRAHKLKVELVISEAGVSLWKRAVTLTPVPTHHHRTRRRARNAALVGTGTPDSKRSLMGYLRAGQVVSSP